MNGPKIYCFYVVTFSLLIGYTITQFHQDDYNIVHDKIIVVNYNKSACVDPKIVVFQYNDTLVMKAINFSAYFTPGVRKNILMNCLLFKQVKKKYRSFPINITLDLCDEFSKFGDSEMFGLRSALSESNFKGCPCAVGFYYVYNIVLDEEKFPPHLPPGNYKLQIRLKVDDRINLMHFDWYGALVPRSNH